MFKYELTFVDTVDAQQCTNDVRSSVYSVTFCDVIFCNQVNDFKRFTFLIKLMTSKVYDSRFSFFEGNVKKSLFVS